jgi:septal ring factor EnvC (AmiA/AmiB activator)
MDSSRSTFSIPIPRTIALTALAVVAAAIVARTGALTPTSRAASIGSLSSQLSHERARQQSLSASVGRLSKLIGSLNSQIALVRSREAAVQAELNKDRAELAKLRGQLARERKVVAVLKGRLARARVILSRQLVSAYEGTTPDLISVVLDAHGFSDLLDELDFLGRAERQQQTTIAQTQQAKTMADVAEQQLSKLETAQIKITEEEAVRARALAGMNALLSSKEAALARAREAQRTALAASRARGAQLQTQISRLRAQQAAAERAAAATGFGAPSGGGPALGPSGGWAIPYAIVLCESGGQDLPPNSAGASGYYQILPSTWKLFGGTGPAAYLASKAEQDAVASRIWNGGAGAGNWVCAGIVGIH